MSYLIAFLSQQQAAPIDANIVIPIIISLLGVIISITTTSFIAGSRYGAMSQTMNTISERLARIEGLFEMKLKE